MRFQPETAQRDPLAKTGPGFDDVNRHPHHGPSPAAVDKILSIGETRAGTSAPAAYRSGPATISNKLDDERIEAQAMVAGFHAAQHELDENHDVAAAPARALHARRHLAHVLVSSRSYGSTADEDAVKRAADSFDQALQRFLNRAKTTPEIEQLIDANLGVRLKLGLGGVSTRTSHHKQGGTDASHAKLVLPRVLHLIAARAEGAIGSLERFTGENRTEVIAKLSAELDDSVRYAQFLIGQLSLAERHAFPQDLELAAKRVHVVLRWIRTRTAHRTMETRFMKTVHAFDSVLLAAGATRIEDREVPALTERSHHAGEQEAAALTAADGKLAIVLDEWKENQNEAVNKFEGLSALVDVEHQPPFLQELLKSLLVAALGHLGGYIIGLAATKVGSALGKAMQVPAPKLTLPDSAKVVSLRVPEVMTGERVVQRIVDVSTDTIQTVAGNAFTTQTNGLDRARTVFASGMRLDVSARLAGYQKNIKDMVENSEITAQQLDMMRFVFEALMSGVQQAYLARAAEAWASYVAQSKLGTTHRKEKGKHVSNVKGYFGKELAGGDRVHGTSKENSAGVLRIELEVHPPGTKPKLQRDRTKVIAMNSEVAAAIIDAANGHLNDVWLPKEVHVLTDYGHAVIALNEKNEVGDVVNWGDVQRKVGLDSGDRFWRVWGKDIVLT